MFNGEANTARLITAHTHPTRVNRLEPLTTSKVTAIITPKPPTLNRSIIPDVEICEKTMDSSTLKRIKCDKNYDNERMQKRFTFVFLGEYIIYIER